MPGHATQLAEIPVEHLVPADWNYKTDATPEQVEKLAESIRKDGSAGVLAVRELGVEVFEVIDGNHRLQAIQRLGWDEVPCENFGEISKAHAITIARRRNYQWFEDDESELAKLMRDIVSKEFDVSDLAQFMPDSPEALEAMFESPYQGTGTAESFDAEGAMEEAEGQEAITKPGDLWLCGPHRILCGDSTKPEDVQRLMADQRAVLFATDPPYLVGCDGMNHPHKWGEPDKPPSPTEPWTGSRSWMTCSITTTSPAVWWTRCPRHAKRSVSGTNTPVGLALLLRPSQGSLGSGRGG